MRTVELKEPHAEPVIETPHARVHLLSPAEDPPGGTELTFLLPSSARVAYVPRAAGDAPAREVEADPLLRGNAFKPLHESPRALAALFSVAAGRRLGTGPESERVIVLLRGTGLVFMENGDVHPFEQNTLVYVPAAEPARVWARGPEDVLGIVLQPNVARPAERRTLASEIAKRREGST